MRLFSLALLLIVLLGTLVRVCYKPTRSEGLKWLLAIVILLVLLKLLAE